MVLPRTPIVLCELAEDMEYEVKRKLEGHPKAQPQVELFYYSTLSYQKPLNRLTSCLRYKFFPYRPASRKSKLTLIDMRDLEFPFGSFQKLYHSGEKGVKAMLTFAEEGGGFYMHADKC